MEPRLVMGPKEMEEERLRYREEYIEMMRKYEGFETFGLPCPMHFNGLLARICDDKRSPCPGLILLYARLGLHRYNLLQGKNLVLSRVKKYNRSFGGCAAATYYVTLEAENLAVPFQTKVSDSYGRFLLHCSIARPLGETKKVKKKSLFGETYGGKRYYQLEPELPSENPFKNTNRFYVLEESELQQNDWIQLYLELAVATTNRKCKESPTELKILQVSIETTQDPEAPNHGHNVYDATFYIRYKDPCEARVGKDVDRIALVRRILDKNTGHLSLLGHTERITPEMPPCEAGVGKDVDVIRRRSLDDKSPVTMIPRKAKKNRFRPLLGVGPFSTRKSYKKWLGSSSGHD